MKNIYLYEEGETYKTILEPFVANELKKVNSF